MQDTQLFGGYNKVCIRCQRSTPMGPVCRSCQMGVPATRPRSKSFGHAEMAAAGLRESMPRYEPLGYSEPQRASGALSSLFPQHEYPQHKYPQQGHSQQGHSHQGHSHENSQQGYSHHENSHHENSQRENSQQGHSQHSPAHDMYGEAPGPSMWAAPAVEKGGLGDVPTPDANVGRRRSASLTSVEMDGRLVAARSLASGADDANFIRLGPPPQDEIVAVVSTGGQKKACDTCGHFKTCSTMRNEKGKNVSVCTACRLELIRRIRETGLARQPSMGSKLSRFFSRGKKDSASAAVPAASPSPDSSPSPPAPIAVPASAPPAAIKSHATPPGVSAPLYPGNSFGGVGHSMSAPSMSNPPPAGNNEYRQVPMAPSSPVNNDPPFGGYDPQQPSFDPYNDSAHDPYNSNQYDQSYDQGQSYDQSYDQGQSYDPYGHDHPHSPSRHHSPPRGYTPSARPQPRSAAPPAKVQTIGGHGARDRSQTAMPPMSGNTFSARSRPKGVPTPFAATPFAAAGSPSPFKRTPVAQGAKGPAFNSNSSAPGGTFNARHDNPAPSFRPAAGPGSPVPTTKVPTFRGPPPGGAPGMAPGLSGPPMPVMSHNRQRAATALDYSNAAQPTDQYGQLTLVRQQEASDDVYGQLQLN